MKELLLIGAVVGAMVLTACATPQAEVVEPGADTPVAVEAAPAPDVLNLSIGQTAQVGDAQVTVTGFHVSEGSLFAADAGNTFLVVDVSVTNTGDDDYDISSLLQTAVRDANQDYEATATFFIDEIDASEMLDGTILVGGTIAGQVGFEVPATATSLQFVFSQVFGGEEARWNLS